MPKRQREHEADFFSNLVAQHSTDSFVVTDIEGHILWCNTSFTDLTGYNLREVQGKKPGEVLQGKATDRKTVSEIGAALRERRAIRREIFNYNKTGAGYWVDLVVTPIFDESGSHTHFMAVTRDITERRKIEEEAKGLFREEEARQAERKLLAQTSEWLYSTKSMDELLTVVYQCIAVMMPEVTGQLYLYANSRNVLDLAVSWGDDNHPPHIAPDDCWALRRGRAYRYGHNMIEFSCGHVEDDTPPYFCLPLVAHGETIGLLHLAFPHIMKDDAAAGLYSQFLDSRWDLALVCTEQISLAIANVRLRTELHEQSVRDQLTGLWNRRWFLDVANRELNRCSASKKPFGLISLDVDHFKKFNDHHGHDAGDEVLRAVGKLMYRSFQEPLTPCRLGGEEFVVICPDMDADACFEIAEEFRNAIQQLELRKGSVDLPTITISQGITVSDTKHPVGLADQLKLADEALYAAKNAGRNQTIVHQNNQEPILWDDPVAAE